MPDLSKLHYVVVTGIVIKDGRYLITRRAPHEKAFPGKWTVPGGKLEPKDYLARPKDTSSHWYNIAEHVLRREVKEETNLEIGSIYYLTSLTFIRPDNIPTVVFSFFADHAGGKVELCKDLTEHAWVTLDEAKKYDLIEGIYEELEMLDSKIKGKAVKEWNKKHSEE